MERLLSTKFATMRSWKLSPFKSAVVTKSGAFPVATVVIGKFVLFTPGILVPEPVPRLAEYCASETGKRSPTKNVAGWVSSARNKMRRAWGTGVEILDK